MINNNLLLVLNHFAFITNNNFNNMSEKIIKTGNEGGVHTLLGEFNEHDGIITIISNCKVVHNSTDPHNELPLPNGERIVVGESVEYNNFADLTKGVID